MHSSFVFVTLEVAGFYYKLLKRSCTAGKLRAKFPFEGALVRHLQVTGDEKCDEQQVDENNY